MSTIRFEILKKSQKSSARVGKLETPHGVIDTPAFLPIATQGTVKTMSPRELLEIETQIILCNTYHLYLRPGVELIEEAGGLHQFMNWSKPILTDSGGFQIYSLSHLRKVSNQGVEFVSHLDGSKHFLTPKKVLEIQTAFGADIIMPLDECVPYPCDKKLAEEAVRRTTSWAMQSKSEMLNLKPEAISESKITIPELFGIVQGSTFKDLRKRSAEEIAALDFPGYAIGGLSVGEPQEKMLEMLEVVTGILPKAKPKHLMGVGFPADILQAVKFGIDLFDCVIPTRLARHGSFLTYEGKVSIRQARFERDFTPIDPECDCYTCQNFSKAYLRHLFWAREITALHLLTTHNLRFYHRMLKKIREEILKE